jgi:sodium transport system permease protein
MISTIFKKELKDTLRDRRTLMTMIIIPIFIFPVIMTIFLKVSEGFAKDVANKTVNIGIVVTPENMNFVKTIENLPKVLGKKKVYVYHDSTTVQKHIQENRLQFGVFVPEDFAKNSLENKTSNFKVFFNATELGMKERAETFLNAFEEMEKAKRYAAVKVDPANL